LSRQLGLLPKLLQLRMGQFALIEQLSHHGRCAPAVQTRGDMFESAPGVHLSAQRWLINVGFVVLLIREKALLLQPFLTVAMVA
jgi:hypothetical protein